MKLAVIFNGQGAQYQNMGLDFSAKYPEAAKVFETAEAVTNYPVREWIEEDIDQLKQTRYAQPAISAVSLAIYDSISSHLPEIDYMAGLSLGEYSALIASGMLSQEEGFKLLQKRGNLMSDQCQNLRENNPAKMVVVLKMPIEEIKKLVAQIHQDDRPLYLANINSTDQVTLAGVKESLSIFKQKAKEAGYKKVLPMKVEGPFHSPLMEDILPDFKRVLDEANFISGNIPVISNTTVRPHQVETVRESLANHMTHSVRWKQTIDLLIEQEVTHVIQIGPGKTLVNLLKRESSAPKQLVIDSVEDVSLIESFLK